MSKKTIRIFISSPGDVQQERIIARKVISEFNELYSKFVKIEVLMWEDFPLTADCTFQEGINFFLKEDIIDYAVFILWSRLGTPLCSKFLKPDGTPYKSGTEYEYDLMRELFQRNGSPRILTYVKTAEPLITSRNTEELLEFIRQQESVKNFLSEHFYDAETNSNYAYLQFEKETSFEEKLKEHLKSLIHSQLGKNVEVREWEGNPYVGLKSFEYEQSSIFFGRRNLVYETTAQLMNNDKIKRALIVLGESGSGKSSFIKAGLLPFLCKENKIGYKIVTPSMFGGKVYHGLIDLLVENYAFLKNNPFIDDLKTGIDENTNFKYLSYALNNNCHNDVIIFIDQFEELFNDSLITEEERYNVILLLKGIVSTQSVSIFISMRSDFYNRFSLYGGLAQIKENAVVVDIPVVGHSEISEIVNEPARKACLGWEINNNGNALNDIIIKDATIIKDLPLIEFALSELYKLRDKNNILTFEAYQKIGGLSGAIIKYADNFYNNLNENEKSALNDIFGFVIAASSSQKQTFVRKTSLLKDVQQSKTHNSVVKKLIDAHILVTGKDHSGQPTISIVHEMLIKHWGIIQDWINEQKDFLYSNLYYEQRVQHWLNNGKSIKDLLQERTALLEAEYFVYKYSNLINDETNEFLMHSIKKERRKGFVWQIIVGAIMLFGLVGLIIFKSYGFKYSEELNELLGDINNMKLPYMLWIYIPILCVLGHSILLRYYAKPKFMTIKYSLYFWIFIMAYLLIDGFYVSNDFFEPTIILINTSLFLVMVSVFLDYRRRYRWQTKKLVSYFISEKWIERIKSLSAGLFVFLAFLYLVMLIMNSENANKDKERLLNVADELFTGLNNISYMLSPVDKYYVNNLHRTYLEEGFPDELNDTIPDDREFQYANALYNLGYPDNAINFLYYDATWKDHLLIIKCLMAIGNYQLAKIILGDYIDNERYDNYGWLKTDELIWVAEKLGEFDYAKRLYKIVDAQNTNSSNNPAYEINRGHIYLAEKNIDDAVDNYKKALDMNPQTSMNIINDLHLFSRFDIIDDALLQDVSKSIGLEFIPSYTNNDTLTTSSVLKALCGNWAWEYEEYGVKYKALLNVENERSYVRYNIFKNNDETLEGVLTIISHLRFEERDTGIIWDEYNPETDGNSYGILKELNDDYFILEVVENGNPDDKGEERLYKRVE